MFVKAEPKAQTLIVGEEKGSILDKGSSGRHPKLVASKLGRFLRPRRIPRAGKRVAEEVAGVQVVVAVKVVEGAVHLVGA